MSSSIKRRRQLWSELSTKFESWILMTDEGLLIEVQKLFPAVAHISREKCLKLLVMDHTDMMVDEPRNNNVNR